MTVYAPNTEEPLWKEEEIEGNLTQRLTNPVYNNWKSSGMTIHTKVKSKGNSAIIDLTIYTHGQHSKLVDRLTARRTPVIFPGPLQLR